MTQPIFLVTYRKGKYFYIFSVPQRRGVKIVKSSFLPLSRGLSSLPWRVFSKISNTPVLRTPQEGDSPSSGRNAPCIAFYCLLARLKTRVPTHSGFDLWWLGFSLTEREGEKCKECHHRNVCLVVDGDVCSACFRVAPCSRLPDRFKILATKIETLRPDLLLVKKTISGLAQEKLLACGVTLVQNVKV